MMKHPTERKWHNWLNGVVQTTCPSMWVRQRRLWWYTQWELGMGTLVQQTARHYSGQWTQLQRSSVPLSPPSWTFYLHDAPVKLPVSWKTPPIPPTVSSSSCHQEDETLTRSVRLLNSFFPQAVRALNANHLTPLWNLIHNPSSWN